MAYDPNAPENQYPKVVEVDGAKFEARDEAHEKALKAGKGDPRVAEAELAAREAEAAEAKRVADEAALKAKEAEQAAKDTAKAVEAPKPAPKRTTKKGR